jgi:hypothetical protein
MPSTRRRGWSSFTRDEKPLSDTSTAPRPFNTPEIRYELPDDIKSTWRRVRRSARQEGRHRGRRTGAVT